VVVEVVGALVDDQRHALLRLYDSSLGDVYGYLARRTPDAATAEDLTAETFLAAAAAAKQGEADLTIAWLIGVARHKLVDHWRRAERDERRLRLIEPVADDDPWDAEIEALRAQQVLATLGAHHRGALTLRYLDGLPVPEVADQLGRTVHATEALLVRARNAFRASYEGSDDDQF
jgi:RNA polymerase sigma-70 factor, ECF subfamily